MVQVTDDTRWLAPAGVIAAVCLGWALQLSNGFLAPSALLLVALAFIVFLAAACLARAPALVRVDRRIVPALAFAGLLVHVTGLTTAPPAMYLRQAGGDRAWFLFGVAAIALSGAAGFAQPKRWGKLLVVGLLLASHFAVGVWILNRSPDPAIDVHLFHRYAIAALRSGTNPYAITFPDIYRNADFYGPGLSVDGRLQFGFPYFPLTLLISVPGQVFGRDPRYAQLATLELAAALMAVSRRNGFGLMAAALYLTTPRIFFVLEQSWTEPIVVFGLAAVTCAACRWERAAPWLFGAFVALKQYLVFALPAGILLAGRDGHWRNVAGLMVKAGIVGAIVTVPFVLWDPAAFWRSVVTLQFHQPFRGDALSVLAWWAAQGHPPPSSSVAFAAASLTAALSVWRLPRTAAGFSAAVALTFLAFFAFNKQAFCNYYFFVVGALLVSVSAWRDSETPA